MTRPSQEQVEKLALILWQTYKSDRNADGSLHDVDMAHARFFLSVIEPLLEALTYGIQDDNPNFKKQIWFVTISDSVYAAWRIHARVALAEFHRRIGGEA